jgi:hypothetical protein
VLKLGGLGRGSSSSLGGRAVPKPSSPVAGVVSLTLLLARVVVVVVIIDLSRYVRTISVKEK